MKLDETNCTNLKQLEITLVGIFNKKLLLILKMYLICYMFQGLTENKLKYKI